MMSPLHPTRWLRLLRHPSEIHPVQVWSVVFATWLFFLSGILSSSPGVLQSLQLQKHLNEAQERATHLESEIARIEAESSRLQKSRVAQEREIRRTLGYASSDEILFDFSAPVRIRE